MSSSESDTLLLFDVISLSSKTTPDCSSVLLPPFLDGTDDLTRDLAAPFVDDSMAIDKVDFGVLGFE